jgi:N-acetylglucosamine-6-sulfatase
VLIPTPFMKKVIEIAIASVLVCFMFQKTMAQQCNVHPPLNLYTTGVTSCSAVLHWTPYDGAAKYKARYKVAGASVWSQSINTGTDTSCVFTGLEAGKTYNLSVLSVCSDGTKSPWKKVNVTTAFCSLPLNPSVIITGPGKAKINCDLICPGDTIYFRYALEGKQFNTYYTTNTDSIILTGLENDSTYDYEISTCPLSSNNWTPASSFIFHFSSPNIIFIVLDDARYDLFSCNGAAPFFQTPAIDRIASEGVNFKNNFAVYSLCAPSRASIATGMYPAKTHVISNETNLDLNPELAVIPELLHDAGYYTALIGKNDSIFKQDGGYFDYWLEWVSGNDSKNQKKYHYNNDVKFINGYLTDVLTDSMLAVIGKVDQPFFIWMAYSAPHTPLFPKPENSNIYDDQQIPLGSDTAAYTDNYPSFLPSYYSKNYSRPDSLQELYKDTYEVIKDVDSSISKLFKSLENAGKLDNTLLIFTSDNGHLYGEHYLFMKRVAYDPSMRVPLFIRYPAWFPESSVVTKQISLNIDLAPTMLEAAGVENNFGMDGLSLRKLFTNEEKRKEMYYHSFYATENNYETLPYARAIRDLKYKYIYYGCENDTTEEFFSLKDDPGETTNLINNASYSTLIQKYRDKLLAAEIQFDDTAGETILDCYIANATTNKIAATVQLSGGDAVMYPNPTNGILNFDLNASGMTMLEIMDLRGVIIYKANLPAGHSSVRIPGVTAGMYTAKIADGMIQYTKKIVVQ